MVVRDRVVEPSQELLLVQGVSVDAGLSRELLPRGFHGFGVEFLALVISRGIVSEVPPPRPLGHVGEVVKLFPETQEPATLVVDVQGNHGRDVRRRRTGPRGDGRARSSGQASGHLDSTLSCLSAVG